MSLLPNGDILVNVFFFINCVQIYFASLLKDGNGNPLQYPCLENLMDRGAWWLQSMGSQRVGHD